MSIKKKKHNEPNAKTISSFVEADKISSGEVEAKKYHSFDELKKDLINEKH